VSRPPTSPPPSSSSADPAEPARTDSEVPGSRVLAWALVGLAAVRRRRDHSAARRTRTDPFRARPVRPGDSPGGSSANGRAPGAGGPGPAATGPQATNGTEGRAVLRSGNGGHGGADGAAPGAPQRPGEEAEAPTQIPPKGWWQVTRRAFKESSADNVGVLAGGIAYFGFLAIFPALIAGISIYGLVADPATIAAQGQSVVAALPQEAQPLIRDQLTAIASTSGGALSFSLVLSILLAVWSASGGTGNLMTAINVAYDEDETRGFVKRRGIALLLTLGAIVFVLLALALVAVIPALLGALQLGTFINVIVQIVRWALLVALVLVALAVVYRVAPDRDAPQFKWTSTGALVATVLWVLGSIGFSLYVNNFGSYNKTYGTLAGVVVLLLWLYLTSYIVLLGAEVNAEAEKQTQKDTTVGPPQPMGERRAEAADTVADPPEPAKK
jgi:membrane protein